MSDLATHLEARFAELTQALETDQTAIVEISRKIAGLQAEREQREAHALQLQGAIKELRDLFARFGEPAQTSVPHDDEPATIAG